MEHGRPPLASCLDTDILTYLSLKGAAMGKKGKKAQAGKPKKLTPKDVGKRINTLAKIVEEELEGADLFAPLRPTDDCAIGLVPLSRVVSNSGHWACCGNIICVACINENEESIKKQNEEKSAGKKLALTCPFCREPRPSSDGYIRQLQARFLQNDHAAFTAMGDLYREGHYLDYGLPRDDLKALDYYIRAVEHGSAPACTGIGKSYREGNGVAVDMERAALFERIGALRGDVCARHNIGNFEYKSGNHEVGIRHWKIAAEGGSQPSIDMLKKVYNNADGTIPGKEFISKEEMDTVYRSGHDAQMEIKTEEREKHCTRHKHDMKC